MPVYLNVQSYEYEKLLAMAYILIKSVQATNQISLFTAV